MRGPLHVGRPKDLSGRLPKEIRVYDLLDELEIGYEMLDHEVTETMEACRLIDLALQPAFICKNLLLCNSQKTKVYLLMMRGDKKFVTRDISKQIGSSRLSFASAEMMEELLDIIPGSLSVLGLMNDRENRVELLVDEEVLSAEYVGCHPCINTSSMRIRTEDVFGKFLSRVGHTYRTVQIEGKPQGGDYEINGNAKSML